MEERDPRMQDPTLGQRVIAVKAFQRQRFAQTYADLLQQVRYASASVFFLDDLYGPADTSERDRQFMRIVPAMVRLFPGDIVKTVQSLSALHALSERLDTAMARVLISDEVSREIYVHAWRSTSAADRERQIELMLRVGSDLDRHTRKPLLRQSLRFMRGPAQAAGLSDLQRFLERGFDTFKNMRGAGEFLTIIGQRERALAAALFKGEFPV